MMSWPLKDCDRCGDQFAESVELKPGNFWAYLCIPCRNGWITYIEDTPECRQYNELMAAYHAAVYGGNETRAIEVVGQAIQVYKKLFAMGRDWVHPAPDGQPGGGGEEAA